MNAIYMKTGLVRLYGFAGAAALGVGLLQLFSGGGFGVVCITGSFALGWALWAKRQPLVRLGPEGLMVKLSPLGRTHVIDFEAIDEVERRDDQLVIRFEGHTVALHRSQLGVGGLHTVDEALLRAAC